MQQNRLCGLDCGLKVWPLTLYEQDKLPFLLSCHLKASIIHLHQYKSLICDLIYLKLFKSVDLLSY